MHWYKREVIYTFSPVVWVGGVQINDAYDSIDNRENDTDREKS